MHCFHQIIKIITSYSSTKILVEVFRVKPIISKRHDADTYRSNLINAHPLRWQKLWGFYFN